MNIIWISDSIEMRRAEMERLTSRLADLGSRMSDSLKAVAALHLEIVAIEQEIETVKAAQLALVREPMRAGFLQGTIDFQQEAAA